MIFIFFFCEETVNMCFECSTHLSPSRRPCPFLYPTEARRPAEKEKGVVMAMGPSSGPGLLRCGQQIRTVLSFIHSAFLAAAILLPLALAPN